MRQPPQGRGAERDPDCGAPARAPRPRRLSLWIWLGLAFGASLVLWLMLVAVLLLLGRRHDAQDVVRFIPDCIILLKRLLADERVPLGPKLAVGLLVPYLVLPFDLIPDFIPIAGQIDDAILVAIVIAYVSRRAGRQVIIELWPGTERGLQIVLAGTQAS